ncbi:ATP-binding cassette domain-containing protein [Furfurilactobacillus cerevisiae]|uniref:ATP-binding cassette domain-containing protein n=1 Tax=Furfurilactobacillus rossiae TaxID=231049 RepID=UPI003B98562E
MQVEIQLDNLGMKFGQIQIFSGLSATLKSGGLIGLLGPNGAGKSTLIKILTTLVKPTSGDVRFDGQSIVRKPGRMRQVLGYLPQQVPFYPNLTANAYLAYIANIKGMSRRDVQTQIHALLEKVNLENTGNKQLKDFSGGMQQRIGIAATLLNDPLVIIADEPSTGLDPEERVALRTLLAELARERLVIISTHIVSDIEAIADDLLILNQGHFMYHGSPNELLRRSDGYVWEYPMSERGQVSNDEASLVSLVQGIDGINVRQIAAQVGHSDAHLVVPTLEEAYIGALNGVIPL